MGDELVQRVLIQLNGGGDFPMSMKESADQSKKLGASVTGINAGMRSVATSGIGLNAILSNTVERADTVLDAFMAVTKTADEMGDAVRDANLWAGKLGNSFNTVAAAAKAAYDVTRMLGAAGGPLDQANLGAGKLAGSFQQAADAAYDISRMMGGRPVHAPREGLAPSAGSVAAARADRDFERSKRGPSGAVRVEVVNPGQFGVQGSVWAATTSARQKARLAELGEDPEEAARNRHDRIASASRYAFGAGAGAIVGLGGLNNPAEAAKFQRAVADFGGSIGRDLVPLLKEGTRAIRMVSDAWVSLPQPIRQAAATVIGLGTVVGGGVLAFNFLRNTMTSVWQTANAAAAAVGRQAAANLVVSRTANTVSLSAAGAAGALGTAGRALPWVAGGLMLLEMLSNRKEGASIGMARRDVAITDTEGYLRELTADSLRAGLSEEKHQSDLLTDILAAIKEKGTAGGVKAVVKAAGGGDDLADAAGFVYRFSTPGLMERGYDWIKDRLR
jgi:hypothetical protein